MSDHDPLSTAVPPTSGPARGDGAAPAGTGADANVTDEHRERNAREVTGDV